MLSADYNSPKKTKKQFCRFHQCRLCYPGEAKDFHCVSLIFCRARVKTQQQPMKRIAEKPVQIIRLFCCTRFGIEASYHSAIETNEWQSWPWRIESFAQSVIACCCYCQSGKLLKTVPFQKSSGNVSLCGEWPSGIILCLRAAEAWRSGGKKLTGAVSTKGRNWRGQRLAEVISHCAQPVPPTTKTITNTS